MYLCHMDDIIVLNDGYENMTKIPKTIEEIEDIMKLT